MSLLAFKDELSKTASLHSALGGLGAGAGLGAGIGALAGGALSGYRNYRQAKDEGADTSSALLRGALGAPGGAIKGGLVGGVLGAGGGAALEHSRPGSFARVLGSESTLGSLARGGQRQVHSLTGWTPEGGISSIRGGAWDAKKSLEGAQGALQNFSKTPVPTEMSSAADKGKYFTQLGALQKAEGQAQKHLSAAQEGERLGLTSLPGYLKSMVRHPADTLKADLGEQWHSGGRLGKALMIAAPMYGVGEALVAGRDTPPEAGVPGYGVSRHTRRGVKALLGSGADEHRGERLGTALGGAAGAVLGSPLPLAGNLALGTGLGAAGKYIGRGIDKLRRPKGGELSPPPPEHSAGQTQPAERLSSNAAMGMPPDGGHW